MRIEVICTGDEVLTGKIVNTNFSYMSQKLGDVGLAVQRAEDKTAQMQARAGAIDELVASGALFKAGILLQASDAIERIAECDTVAFDKTGTLTTPEPRVVNAGEVAPDLAHVAYITDYHEGAAEGADVRVRDLVSGADVLIERGERFLLVHRRPPVASCDDGQST